MTWTWLRYPLFCQRCVFVCVCAPLYILIPPPPFLALAFSPLLCLVALTGDGRALHSGCFPLDHPTAHEGRRALHLVRNTLLYNRVSCRSPLRAIPLCSLKEPSCSFLKRKTHTHKPVGPELVISIRLSVFSVSCPCFGCLPQLNNCLEPSGCPVAVRAQTLSFHWLGGANRVDWLTVDASPVCAALLAFVVMPVFVCTHDLKRR